MYNYIVLPLWWVVLSNEVLAIQVYDSYRGEVISPQEYADHVRRNTTFWCTQEVEPCNPYEGRRIDGSCNNLRHPSRGSSHTPSHHVLPLVFGENYEPRRSKRGEELPLSRKVRTTLLAEGRVPDQYFTHLLTYFSVFVSADILSFHDTINYLVWTPHCCEERGKTDPQCIRQTIPDDDPVHRFSSDRCFNLTRPWTFQSKGCVSNSSSPERVTTATTFFDLSQLYGDNTQSFKTKRRLLKNGLLKYEMEEGRIWPPSFQTFPSLCLLNVGPTETRCHDIGEESCNGILGTNLFTIWMWRHHNFIANELSRINPCWDDEKLFYTARDINIAVVNQIFFYELNPILLGEENLYREGVLSLSSGFRDIYMTKTYCLKYLLNTVSFYVGLTLFRKVLQSRLYDTEGNYLKSMRIANLTLRTGYLADQNHIDYITQGAFRQAAGKIDSTIDPDIAETGLGTLQKISDISTSDLAKNRYFGLAPYIEYRRYCFGEIIRTFDDLTQAIDLEKIELLKELYSDVEDVDLLAGIWIERPISGARVPATFYCLVVDQLKRSIVSDRHWYERQNRPNAFNIQQLLEIRKSSIARLMCDVGDKVTKIQPQAFLVAGPWNEISDCSNIKKIDLGAWRDHRCYFNEIF